MSKDINFIFRTTGWGGNELMALSIAKAISSVGGVVNIYANESQVGQVELSGAFNVFSSGCLSYRNSSANIYVLPSFVSILKHCRIRDLFDKKNWFYAPFVGYEWSSSLSRCFKFLLAFFVFRLVGWRVIGIRYDFLSAWFLPRKDLVVFPNVPFNYTNGRFVGDSNSKLSFLCIGRIEYAQKCQDKLLLLLESLIDSDRLPDFKLIFIGDGPDQDDLRKKTQGLDWVDLHPWCDPTLFFTPTSVLILPSAYEGLPLVALEAIESSVPVIATHESGLATIISSDSLFKLNTESLLSAIVNVINNRNRELTYASERINGKYCAFSLKSSVQNWLSGKVE